MFCPNCGTEISPAEKVCPSCGAPLPDRTVQETEAVPERDETVATSATEAKPAPASKPQASQQWFAGTLLRIVAIAMGVVILVIGMSKVAGTSNVTRPSPPTAFTPRSTGRNDDTSSGGGTDTDGGSKTTKTDSGSGRPTDEPADVLSDPELRDAYGNITLHALMELDGKQFVALCNMQHFEVYPNNGYLAFVNQARHSVLSICGSNGALDYNSVLGLAKGGKGKACASIYIIDAYDSEKATYQGISHCETECSAMAHGEYVAICRDSSGRRWIATVNAQGDGSHHIVLYNPEALKAGLFDEMHDGEYGKYADIVFITFTGKLTDTHE
ncbi:MAG: zinc-ribbon domain-containing protein [Coriobacteriales bacterium]|nr:zinc-ribbon domain-containing protein [Coriobacteriales bacterium]